MSIICLNMSLALFKAGIRPAQQALKSMSCSRLLDWRTGSRLTSLRRSGSAGLQHSLPAPQQAWQDPTAGTAEQNSPIWVIPHRCVTTDQHLHPPATFSSAPHPVLLASVPQFPAQALLLELKPITFSPLHIYMQNCSSVFS